MTQDRMTVATVESDPILKGTQASVAQITVSSLINGSAQTDTGDLKYGGTQATVAKNTDSTPIETSPQTDKRDPLSKGVPRAPLWAKAGQVTRGSIKRTVDTETNDQNRQPYA